MKLQYNGEEQIPAAPDHVWTFVTDPEKVGRCFPDVLDVAVEDATHFDERAIKNCDFCGNLHAGVTITKRRLDVKITGGGFGSAVDMTAAAELVEAGAGATALKWSGEAVARGPVAAVGGRVLDAQAKKLISQTFATVRERLAAE